MSPIDLLRFLGLAGLIVVLVACTSQAPPESRPDERPEDVAPSTSPEELAREARSAREAGDLERSLELFENALRAEPNHLRRGAEYRQVAIAAEAYDRSIDFFETLVESHPAAAHAHLNLAYARIDKTPVAGAISSIGLANSALEDFGRAIEIEESWLARHSRGESYLYWPLAFGRAELGIADLERAIEIAESGPQKPYHAKSWASLGDGHARRGDLAKAREAWQRGLETYPESDALRRRLALEDEAIDHFLEERFDPAKRPATDLADLWAGEDRRPPDEGPTNSPNPR